MALLDTLATQGKTINDKIDGYTEEQRYFLGFARYGARTRPSRRPPVSAGDPPLARPLAR